jgi:hypothetical protein
MTATSGVPSKQIGAAYDRHIRGEPIEGSLVATIAYFVTLVLVRAYTTIAHPIPGAPDITIGETHIHHVVPGVIVLLVAGVLALDDVARLPRAALFGIGAALVLDELALIVFLRDVYWLREGSLSLVAVLIGLVALAINAWRGRRFLAAVMAILGRSRADDPDRGRGA